MYLYELNGLSVLPRAVHRCMYIAALILHRVIALRDDICNAMSCGLCRFASRYRIVLLCPCDSGCKANKRQGSERADAAPHGPDGAIYPGTCRSLSKDEQTTRIEAGERFARRLKLPADIDLKIVFAPVTKGTISPIQFRYVSNVWISVPGIYRLSFSQRIFYGAIWALASGVCRWPIG